MKTDNLSFSFVAAIVLAGVIVALTSPAHPPAAVIAAPVASVAHAAPNDPIDSSIMESHLAPDLSVSE